MKSPISAVKEKFGDKAKLVAEVEAFTKGDDLWVSRLNANKGLAHVSNAKLLRLHQTFTTVKEKFGTRAKLIDAIAELEKRAKDEGYKTRLATYPVPRLWDLYQSSAKRNAPKKEVKKSARTAPAKKEAVKKAAAAKKAAVGARNKKPAAKAKKKK
jgi:hypothetical protein